jgi:hypothetical protein
LKKIENNLISRFEISASQVAMHQSSRARKLLTCKPVLPSVHCPSTLTPDSIISDTVCTSPGFE